MNTVPTNDNSGGEVATRPDTATPTVRGDRTAAAMDLLSGAIIVVGLMVLIPTTLFYLIVVGAFVFLPKSDSFEFNGDFLYVLTFFSICGYGLYALWWLVPRMRRVTFGQIPKRVWGGLLGGAVVATALVLPSTPAHGPGPVSLAAMLAALLTGQVNKLGDLLGGAPLLLLCLTLVVMLLDRWHGKRRARRAD